jgi:NTP pyrophosphatase (non-canonical NTP hydrolase)
LLAAGLIGEAGSIVAEQKKVSREEDAYPVYRQRMQEEIGDFLWYFVRCAYVLDPSLIAELQSRPQAEVAKDSQSPLPAILDFGQAVGRILVCVKRPASLEETRKSVMLTWDLLQLVASNAKVILEDAARGNIDKVESRWPKDRTYSALFDEVFTEEEQLPRTLEVSFRERQQGDRKVTFLRCNGINFGDRITDNILDPDGYRYHDIFHFAYVVHLGWSPVVRAILNCKRKSIGRIDEAEDGARAGIIEEAVSAIVFSRAKQLKYFKGLDHVDFDLLKTIREFVMGYEVEKVPMWQWETAILDGYRVFRGLLENSGGIVRLDLHGHHIAYTHPS